MSEFTFACPACGQTITGDTAQSGLDMNCPVCQAMIVVPMDTAGTTGEPLPATTPPPWMGYNAAPPEPRTSPLAIASLVCSLSSLVTCVGWIPGIICGHLAKSRLRRDPSLRGNGLAVAGLTIGYLIFLLQLGLGAKYAWSFSKAVQHGYDQAREVVRTNTLVVANAVAVTSSVPVAVSNISSENPAAATADSGWTTDLSETPYPDDAVAGKIHGADFSFKSATFRGANLRITSVNGLAVQVLGLGAEIQDRNWEIESTNDAEGSPRVMMSWTENGSLQTVTYQRDYGLKLEFGTANKRRISGKIYLCFPDDAKSYVAGTFQMRLPKPKQ